MKKFVSIILVAMMVCCLAVTAMADTAFTATITNANVIAGETVTVKVTLSQAITDVGSGNLEVTYPASLTLVDAEWIVDALIVDFDLDTDRGVFAFETTDTISGDIAALTFIADGATPGDELTVSAMFRVKDGMNTELSVDVADGKITVEDAECQHDFNTNWSSDADYHWHNCKNGCGEIADKAAHVYSNACDKTCNVCGAKRTVTHDYSEEWVIEADSHWKECKECGAKTQNGPHMGTVLVGAKAASCDEDGYTGDMCCICGKLMTKGTVIPATGHHYVNGKCVDCGADENPQTGDALAILVAVAVVSVGAAALTFKKRK